jgi:PAS domain S-box-containing protein
MFGREASMLPGGSAEDSHVSERTPPRLWEWDPATDEVTWTSNLDNLCLSESDESRTTLTEFLKNLLPEDREGVKAELAAAVERGGEAFLEFRLMRSEGDVRWMAWHGKLIQPDGAEAPRLAGVGMDISDIHHVNRMIRERNELLRTTVRSIGDAVITTDANGRITFLNPVAEELTGWKNEEVTGLPSEEVFRIVNEQTRIKVESPVHKVLRDGLIVGLANHTVLIARDGTERPIDDSGAPIKGDDESILGAVLVFRDITERRKMDEAVQRLAAIVESSDDAIISKDLNGIITTWNRAAERIYGYSADEMIGRSKARLIPADLPNELTNILEQVRAGNKIEHYETVRVRKDGSRIDLSISVSPILDSDGRVIGASTIARDITHQKKRERSISESENRLNGILQSAMDAIITIDEDQKIVFFNSAAERMFQTSAHEAIGAPIDQFLPERYRGAHRRHILRFGETGTTMRTMGELGAISGLRANGEEFPIEASISQTEVGGGRIYTVILRDITERLRAYEASRLHQAEVEALNEQLQRSMKETHHRVRNSLQLIAALTDMQAMDGRTVVPATDLNRIQSQVRALAAVHDILTREAGNRGDANELSAREMLERLLTLFREATPEREISAHLDDVRISAKQGSSMAVIANELVTNAIKYSEGPVTVRFSSSDNTGVLEVLDRGKGFEKGFDPEKSQKTGLSLVCHIARWDLGGNIDFGSAKDGGGRAAVTIPLDRRS